MDRLGLRAFVFGNALGDHWRESGNQVFVLCCDVLRFFWIICVIVELGEYWWSGGFAIVPPFDQPVSVGSKGITHQVVFEEVAIPLFVHLFFDAGFDF